MEAVGNLVEQLLLPWLSRRAGDKIGMEVARTVRGRGEHQHHACLGCIPASLSFRPRRPPAMPQRQKDTLGLREPQEGRAVLDKPHPLSSGIVDDTWSRSKG